MPRRNQHQSSDGSTTGTEDDSIVHRVQIALRRGLISSAQAHRLIELSPPEPSQQSSSGETSRRSLWEYPTPPSRNWSRDMSLEQLQRDSDPTLPEMPPTPDRSYHFGTGTLSISPGPTQSPVALGNVTVDINWDPVPLYGLESIRRSTSGNTSSARRRDDMPREFVWAISALGDDPDALLTCTGCGGQVPARDCHIDSHRHIVCTTCRNLRERPCTDCGRVYPVDHLRQYAGTTYLCSSCRENYFTCQRCHKPVHKQRDGVYRSANNGTVCETCWKQIPRIYHYGHKPDPVFFQMPDEKPRKRGYGVENEIDGGDVNDFFGREVDFDEVYYKHDGSLGPDGIECVTHPASLRYHMEKMPWAEILAAAKQAGYSGRRQNVGTHIHISRRMFGAVVDEQEANIAKFMLLVDRFWPQMIRFSLRTESAASQWAARFNAVSNDNPIDEDDLGRITDRMKRTASGHRHIAVNIGNTNTVEFRLFKGTLSKTILIAMLQFTDHMVQFCKRVPFDVVGMISWDELIEDIKHEELDSFLKKRGLKQ